MGAILSIGVRFEGVRVQRALRVAISEDMGWVD